MNKKNGISKVANKLLLAMVYILFFTVQLNLQYHAPSAVDFLNSAVSKTDLNKAQPKAHKELKQGTASAHHNRLNKRYQPESPIEITDFFVYHYLVYPPVTGQYFQGRDPQNHHFLSTYLLRGPPITA